MQLGPVFGSMDQLPDIVGRKREIKQLADALARPKAIVEVVGPGGYGKTSLIAKFAHDQHGLFPGGVEYIHSGVGERMSEGLDALVSRFRQAGGRRLLYIDDAELMAPADTMQALQVLNSGRWDLATLISGRTGIGVGQRIVLGPLSQSDLREMVNRCSPGLDDATIEMIWRQSRGSPRAAVLLLNDWRSDPDRSVEKLERLFELFTFPGLIGPDGNPLTRGGSSERAIIEKVKLVSGELLRVVAVRPELLFQLEPREFEEFAAEMFEQQGFEVTLTQRTRDGGKDLYLAQSNLLGSFRYAVECKRYSSKHPVRVGVIRSLQGIVSREKLTAGIVLTTSHFTRDAIEEARQTQYQMSLRDFTDLRTSLEAFNPHR